MKTNELSERELESISGGVIPVDYPNCGYPGGAEGPSQTQIAIGLAQQVGTAILTAGLGH